MNSISSKTLKIAVVAIILILITGIWYVKNEQGQPKQEEISAVEDNSEFALHVTDSLDLEELKSKGLPIVIDFGADSCIPCKEMAPVLKELNIEMQGRAIVKFVDVWKYQSLAEGFPISVIPTQIFIGADGKPFVPKDPEGLQMNMYSSKETGEHIFTTHEGGMKKEELLKVLSEMGVN